MYWKLHTQTFKTSFSTLCGMDTSVETHWYRNREGGSSRVGSSRQDVITACVGRPGSFKPHTRGSTSQAWRCVVEPVKAMHISRAVEKSRNCAADTGFPYCNHHSLSIIKITSYYAVRYKIQIQLFPLINANQTLKCSSGKIWTSSSHEPSTAVSGALHTPT